MNIRTAEQIQGQELGAYQVPSNENIEPLSSGPQFTSIQTINDSVQQASQWVRPLEKG